MSRIFRLCENWYEADGDKIFKKKQIKIETGLTVLVGCNGAGKTTMLDQVEEKLKDKNIPVLYHSNFRNGERELKDKSAFYGDFHTVARLMSGSEGENIIVVLEKISKDIGTIVRQNPDAKELWLLFDAIDSGLSVDNIVDFKEQLVEFIIEDNIGKDIYFLISANEYEFARGEKCFDVINGEYISFSDYEDYRTFILQTKEEKLKRYKK